mmetsp:Transcript_37849/g.120674  ORF Transcript_37849/g.120674 Transcript_37849/m.120674 type:complete len:866 (-) Transcript_37849:768-3365(-)
MPLASFVGKDAAKRHWGSQYDDYHTVNEDTPTKDNELLSASRDSILKWVAKMPKEEAVWVLGSLKKDSKYRTEVEALSQLAATGGIACEVINEKPRTEQEADGNTSPKRSILAWGKNQQVDGNKSPRRPILAWGLSPRKANPTVPSLGPEDLERESSRVSSSVARDESRMSEDTAGGVPLLQDFKSHEARRNEGGKANSVAPMKEADMPVITEAGEDEKDQVERDVFHRLSSVDQKMFATPFVQFGSFRNFCVEGDSTVSIEVFRIGNLEEPSSVAFTTKQGSAKAGVIYVDTKGVLTFEPGEHRKCIEVPILDDNSWNPATEFNLVLDSEGIVNASLGRYLNETRVSVMDDGAFPTNRFSEHVSEQIEKRKGAYYLGKLEGIPKAGLLFEYIKLNMRDPMIYKGTIKTLIVDQLHNLYAFMQLFLKVYLVDFILTETTSVDRLIVFHDRKQSLMLLTAFAVVPFALLHYLDYIKFTWRVRGVSKKNLQGSIVRKFLSYRSEVRGDLSQGTLILAMTRDSTQVVDFGFMASITLLKAIGSIILMFSYPFIAQLVFNKPVRLTVAFAMVIYPVFLCAFIYVLSAKNFRSLEDYNDSSDELVVHVDNIVLSCQVIHDFDASQPFVQQFEAKVGKYNNAAIATGQLMLNNSYFAQWLAVIVVVCYTIKGGLEVVSGSLSLGVFLIDCQIFHAVGVSWGTVYDIVLLMQSSTPRLERVTTLLNFPVDSHQQMELFKFRRDVTKQMRGEIVEMQCTKLPVDLLPIRIVDPTKAATVAGFSMHWKAEVDSPEARAGLSTFWGPTARVSRPSCAISVEHSCKRQTMITRCSCLHTSGLCTCHPSRFSSKVRSTTTWSLEFRKAMPTVTWTAS